MIQPQTEHDLVLHSQNVSRLVVVRDSLVTVIIWVVWFALCEGFIAHVLEGLKDEETKLDIVLDLVVIFFTPIAPYLLFLVLLIFLLGLGAWLNRDTWLFMKSSTTALPPLGLEQEAAYFSTNPTALSDWKSTRSIALTLDEHTKITEVQTCLTGDHVEPER